MTAGTTNKEEEVLDDLKEVSYVEVKEYSYKLVVDVNSPSFCPAATVFYIEGDKKR